MRGVTTAFSDYDWSDDLALASGLGLVLFGVVVIGFFETLLGSPHFTERSIRLGVIVVHTSFTPHLRAYIIALGFLVLLMWGSFRISRAIVVSF